MKLIDTHNHIYLEEFDPEQDALIREAQDSGIDALLLPNVDLETIDRMHAICDRYPDYLFPMMGLHPTSVQADYAADLKKVESCFGKRTYCAVGEIGIGTRLIGYSRSKYSKNSCAGVWIWIFR
jgi:TatD DNase family protein